jgi:hypothetical protein
MKNKDDNNLDLVKMVELVTVEGMMEGSIIKSKLESFEIPCQLKYEAVGVILGITTDGLGKIQVMVPPDFLEKALEILEAEDDAEADDDMADQESEEK